MLIQNPGQVDLRQYAKHFGTHAYVQVLPRITAILNSSNLSVVTSDGTPAGSYSTVTANEWYSNKVSILAGIEQQLIAEQVLLDDIELREAEELIRLEKKELNTLIRLPSYLRAQFLLKLYPLDK